MSEKNLEQRVKDLEEIAQNLYDSLNGLIQHMEVMTPAVQDLGNRVVTLTELAAKSQKRVTLPSEKDIVARMELDGVSWEVASKALIQEAASKSIEEAENDNSTERPLHVPV